MPLFLWRREPIRRKDITLLETQWLRSPPDGWR